MHHEKVGVLARRVPAQALMQREPKHFFSANKRSNAREKQKQRKILTYKTCSSTRSCAITPAT